jgi:hypothetical protein
MLSWRDRERIKTEEALRRNAALPAKKRWASLSYASVTATLALLISGSSLYFSTFYEHRALSIAIPTIPDTKYRSPDRLDVSVATVISNRGNRYETVLAVYLTLVQGGTRRNRTPSGPYVLKPGESLPVPLEFNVLASYRCCDDKADLNLNVETVSPNGSILRSSISFSIITFQEIFMKSNRDPPTIFIKQEPSPSFTPVNWLFVK